MDKRFVLFITLAFGILVLNAYVHRWLNPPPAVEQEEAAPGAEAKDGEAKDATPKGADDAPEQESAAKAEKPAEAKQPAEATAAKPEEKETPKPDGGDKKPAEDGKKPLAEKKQEHPLRYLSLGSADPNDPYRMLVTLCSRGATVSRVELNSPRYQSLMGPNGTLKDRSGYLGRVVVDESVRGKGCPVQVVGKGTPAAKAGIKPGDLILSLGGKRVTGLATLREALRPTRPGDEVPVVILRDGAEKEFNVTLANRPMDVIRPEGEDPQSFLLTLNRLDGADLSPKKDAADLQQSEDNTFAELPGIDMYGANWEVASLDEKKVVFRYVLPDKGLEVLKTYEVVQVPADAMEDPAFRGYHLKFDIVVRNIGAAPREVAYRLNGPNGLPIEGWWYANKVGRCWSAGLRDFVASFDEETPIMVGCGTIAKGKHDPPIEDRSITFIGVDAQYFSSVLIPKKKNPTDIWFYQSEPVLVGPVEEDLEKKANTSCRLVSMTATLPPGKSSGHQFDIFVGPKNTEILAGYDLDELVYYGWFSWAAKPMVKTLHFFYYFTWNYALAIILLTVLVRSCMYPLSRKQVASAAKMQELQPEIKKLQEKYKKDLEARSKAQQELFRKHNYNPLMGCLPLFIQLPIFIALYRSLMVDIELRQQPLITSSLGWCTNLAAPDMLFNWSSFMPDFVTSGIGMFGLGPYFNLLPIITIVLFMWQQKVMMPPAMDEQQAMQQKMMKYMMLFFAILFFKVAAGLCLYFIATSIWSVAERKLLPRSDKKPAASKEAAQDWKQVRKEAGKKGKK